MTVNAFKNWLHGRTVVVTGHTGFKGSWLTMWLDSLGAKVVGISLAPGQGEHAIFTRANIAGLCGSHIQDIRDYEAIQQIFELSQPEIVFHLAAQALVPAAYADPLGTFSTNIIGTANVLEAARKTPSIKALVCVTTDKVYDNNEQNQAFVETDALGGNDPYSASKAAAEMVARSYMRTLIPQNGTLELATARGGNVVGGGDWSKDRIIPDLIRAWHAGQPLILRNPHATRPWQHVLELCFGYMMLAYRLECGSENESRTAFRGTWNFGPEPDNEIPVNSLVQKMLVALEQPNYPIEYQTSHLHESTYLRLNSNKSKMHLGWQPLLTMDDTIAWTAKWYRDYLQNPAMAASLIEQHIAQYEALILSNIKRI